MARVRALARARSGAKRLHPSRKLIEHASVVFAGPSKRMPFPADVERAVALARPFKCTLAPIRL
eukprot:1141570-Pleurochrysis_carterae.AAC.5